MKSGLIDLRGSDRLFNYHIEREGYKDVVGSMNQIKFWLE